MLRILDRYVLREVFPSFILGIGVFTFVILAESAKKECTSRTRGHGVSTRWWCR